MRTRHIRHVLALFLGLAVSLTSNPLRAAEPEIVGSAKYISQVHQALALLHERDIAAYTIVTNNVGRIREGQHSGMWAYSTPPTYEMSDVTAFYSLTWCTATIAHDSFHSKLYHDYQKDHGTHSVPDAIWTGISAEQQCMKHQLEVMKHIGATGLEIAYAEKQADGHYVKQNQGWLGSWLAYVNRSW